MARDKNFRRAQDAKKAAKKEFALALKEKKADRLK